jgi:hypothetical protein
MPDVYTTDFCIRDFDSYVIAITSAVKGHILVTSVLLTRGPTSPKTIHGFRSVNVPKQRAPTEADTHCLHKGYWLSSQLSVGSERGSEANYQNFRLARLELDASC